MTGFTEISAPQLGTLVASGDGGNGQGVLLLVLVLGGAAFIAAVTVVNRFRQPFVLVLENPFKFLMKAVMFGVTSTAVLVTLVTVVIVTASFPT